MITAVEPRLTEGVLDVFGVNLWRKTFAVQATIYLSETSRTELEILGYTEHPSGIQQLYPDFRIQGKLKD